nr:retrovirus-related Pol polyprotein from transposon TNT 1-94 [Tanacetum cinerariifolium]
FFDHSLIDEVTEVQNVFKQMELAVKQHRKEKHKFQNKMENVSQENDRLLTQALSVEIVNVVVHDNVKSTCLDVDVCAHCNRTAHTDYIRHTQDEAATLREIVESERLLSPLNTSLDYALGNVCPLTRIATPTIVPPREPIPIVNSMDKPVVTLVVKIILWYLDSGCSKHMTGDRSQLVNFVQTFLGMVKFDNDHVAKIMGYGDYQIGNVTIFWVYYVEGLGYNPSFL